MNESVILRKKRLSVILRKKDLLLINEYDKITNCDM